MKNAGSYILTSSDAGGENYEVRAFKHLQHAIVHAIQKGKRRPWGFTAQIQYDNQDMDGKLLPVADFNDNGGWRFSTVYLPLGE